MTGTWEPSASVQIGTRKRQDELLRRFDVSAGHLENDKALNRGICLYQENALYYRPDLARTGGLAPESG